MEREELIKIAAPYVDMFSSENRADALEHFVQFLEYVNDEYNFVIVDNRDILHEYKNLKETLKIENSSFVRGRLHELEHLFGKLLG